MQIKSITPHERFLTIDWVEGGTDNFHYVWLRDHLPDTTFFDTDTGERLIDAHTYLFDVAPEDVSSDINGDLEITWPGADQPSCYLAHWLYANRYTNDTLAARDAFIPSPEAWPYQSFDEVPRYDYAKIFDEPQAGFELLHNFRTYGFAFIDGAPAAVGVVENFANWLGYVREVVFGPVRDIRSEPNYDNVAFTSRDVKPHIDGSNYIYPYEVQFLHCIENGAEGGDSDVVDGFAVAEKLKAVDPAAFDVLTRVKVAYRIGAGEHDLRHSAPVIGLDREGELHIIRFSNQQRRVLSVPFDDVEAFYAAYGLFSQMINAPENKMHFRFAPGEVLMFNNHRILHARDAFKPDTGRRHMQLATADMDMVDSRLRLLVRQLGRNDDLDLVLPREP